MANETRARGRRRALGVETAAPMRSLCFISAPALTRAVTTHEGAMTTRFRLLALSHVSVRSTERGLSACVGHIFGLVSTVVAASKSGHLPEYPHVAASNAGRLPEYSRIAIATYSYV